MARKRRGRGEGAIYRRADGQWCSCVSLGYDENGKRKRRVVYGATKQEVQEKLDDLRRKVRGGQPLTAEKMTVADYLAGWLENTKRPAVGDTTYDRYEQHVRLSIVPHIGSVPLVKLTKYHVEQLYAEMAKAGVSRAEQRKAGAALRNALKHAVADDLIPKNPAALVPLPRREESAPSKAVVPLEGDQPDHLLAAAAAGLRAKKISGPSDPPGRGPPGLGPGLPGRDLVEPLETAGGACLGGGRAVATDPSGGG
jgi:hypothetical protein